MSNDLAIKITPLTQADYESWLKLWQDYLRFYETSLPPSTTQATWDRIVDNELTMYGFGAWQDDKMVGITHLVLHPNT